MFGGGGGGGGEVPALDLCNNNIVDEGHNVWVSFTSRRKSALSLTISKIIAIVHRLVSESIGNQLFTQTNGCL
jgi:hypothetical protein